MFIGHYALGLAAKRAAPRTSLGTLFIAPTLADLLWPFLLLLGLEHVHAVRVRIRFWSGGSTIIPTRTACSYCSCGAPCSGISTAPAPVTSVLPW